MSNHGTNAAADPRVVLGLWEYLADYAIVNWARWDMSPLRHFWHQLSKKSFWNYVTPNLEANCAGSMPIYCRLA